MTLTAVMETSKEDVKKASERYWSKKRMPCIWDKVTKVKEVL